MGDPQQTGLVGLGGEDTSGGLPVEQVTLSETNTLRGHFTKWNLLVHLLEF